MGASNNLTWHHGLVTPTARARLLCQTPVTLWFTGLSGSGKSTLATTLEAALHAQGRACFVLDGDNVRQGLCKDLGFSDEDRSENIRRIAEIARLMNDAGLIVITAFISPFIRDRIIAREIVGSERFTEIHLDASLAVCEKRDPKGLYKQARAGKLPGFTGIGSPYEPPTSPDLSVPTGEVSLEQSLFMTLDHLGLPAISLIDLQLENSDSWCC